MNGQPDGGIVANSGDRIGRWTLGNRLGSGDFGDVFFASDGDLEGALKLVNGPNESALARLTVERDALRVMDHPRIPRVLDTGSGDTDRYFVMSIVPGETMSSRVSAWNQLGRVHGAVESAEIIFGLIDALNHVHSRDMVHRDIKDANVILNGTDAYLIDFGFCKRAGMSSLRSKDSFWRAGAARFSPLEKLDDSALAAPSHDVYGIGVLAYRLVTGEFPWSVAPDEGLKALREKIRNTPLVAPHESNSLVPIALSRFISSLLVQDDRRRPTSSAALDEITDIVERLRVDGNRAPRSRAQEPHPHVVRDQVYGDIRLTDFEYAVMNTPEMQRLRWIKQLGLTNLVYPGAEHSRLSHSVGSVDRVERIFRAIEDEAGIRLEADTRQATRLLALTHDVAHIASGHTIEDELGFFVRHDKNIGRFERLVSNDSSQLGRLLRGNDVGRMVLDFLDPRVSSDEESLIEQAVSGVMGADVLDYIDRDAYNCGLDHRVDSAIFRQIKFYARESSTESKVFSNAAGKYGIRVDRTYAIESLLAERYALFLKVYTHSAKLAADAVLSKALGHLSKSKSSLREPDFEWFGDEVLLHTLSNSRVSKVGDYGRMLKQRRLPRGVYRARMLNQDQFNHRDYLDVGARLKEAGVLTPEGRRAIESDIARKSGVPAERVFFYLPESAPGYKRTTQLWSSQQLGAQPQLEEVQRGIGRRHLALWEAWAFVLDGTEQERLSVASASEDVLHRHNMIEQYGRPALLDL